MTLSQWADWLESQPPSSDRLLSYEDARELAMAMRTAAAQVQAIEDGGYDLSPCGVCGKPVVCIPDGLPMCGGCARKDGA